MIKKVFTLLFILLAVAACGQTNGENTNSSGDKVVEMIDVELTAPEKVTAGETAEFQVVVTQGKKPVDNADEVKFEFWQTNAKEKSEKVEAEPQGEGVYSVKHTFNANGEFHVQSHVTADSMHIMPKKTFTVTGGEKKGASAQSGEHKHDDSSLEATLKTKEPATAGQETGLEVGVNQNGTPLKDANVTLEIIENENADPVWVNLNENDPGIYKGNATFSKSGSVLVNVHIKKDDLHEHIEKTIEITD